MKRYLLAALIGAAAAPAVAGAALRPAPSDVPACRAGFAGAPIDAALRARLTGRAGALRPCATPGAASAPAGHADPAEFAFRPAVPAPERTSAPAGNGAADR